MNARRLAVLVVLALGVSMLTACDPLSPLAPTDVGPTSSLSLTPTLSAFYDDPQDDGGFVRFEVRDVNAPEIVVTGGDGSHVASDNRSSWTVTAPLSVGHAYQIISYGIDDTGKQGVATNTPLSISRIRVDAPAANAVTFHDEPVTVELDPTLAPTTVDVVVDGTVIATATSAPWSSSIPTASLTNGAHQLVVRANTAGGAVESPTSPFTIDNTLSSEARVEADAGKGLLDAGDHVSLGITVQLGANGLPPRYQSTFPSPGEDHDATTDVLTLLTDNWDALSEPERESVRDALATTVVKTPEPDPPSGGVDGPDFGYEPGDGDKYTGCKPEFQAAGRINGQNSEWCTTTINYVGPNPNVPDIEFYFTVGSGGPDDVADQDLGNDKIPDEVTTAAANMFTAFEVYLGDLGYSLDDRYDSHPVMVVIADARGFTNPYSLTTGNEYNPITIGRRWNATIEVPGNRQNVESTPRHEAFHLVQYHYLSLFDVIGQYFCYDCRNGTLWWMEASATWAEHQVNERRTLEGETDYFTSLPFFANSPRSPFFEFGQDPALNGRGYGGFVLAEYLERRYGEETIREIWEFFGADDGRALDEALDVVIQSQGGTRSDLISDFWLAAYLLTHDEAKVPSHLTIHSEEPAVAQWRNQLQTSTDPQFSGLHGDSFLSYARPARLRPAVPIDPPSGQERIEQFKLGAGGAHYLDLEISAFRTGWFTIKRSTNKASLRMYALRWKAGSDEPCDVDPVTPFPVQEEFGIRGTFECPRATLVVVEPDLQLRHTKTKVTLKLGYASDA